MVARHAATSRRAVLLGGGVAVAAGASAFAAGCGGGDESGTPKPGPADADVLNTLLDAEYAAVAAYRVAATHLSAPDRAAVAPFGPQEQEHAGALARAIGDLGATPHRPRAAYAYPPFPDDRAVMNFLNSMEETVIAAYMDAVPKITDPGLRGMVASIGTVEAQHAAVVRGVLGIPQVPEAFERGTA